MARSGGTIDSIDALRRRMPTIVKSVNADPELALRASANPLLALEELGYELSDRLRDEAELRSRFSVENASTLTSLREDVEQQLGREVDLRSAASVIRALATIGVKISAKAVKVVGLEKTGGDSPPDPVVVQTTQTTPRRGRTAKATRHPPVVEPPASSVAVDDSRQLLPLLRERVGAHHVIEPLVQYLELEASTPRLADEETYARLRERSADPERTEIHIRFVLQRDRDDA